MGEIINLPENNVIDSREDALVQISESLLLDTNPTASAIVGTGFACSDFFIQKISHTLHHSSSPQKVTNLIDTAKNSVVSYAYTDFGATTKSEISAELAKQGIRFGATANEHIIYYYTAMYKNGKRYSLEVLYDFATNTILHFKYTHSAIDNLPEILKK